MPQSALLAAVIKLNLGTDRLLPSVDNRAEAQPSESHDDLWPALKYFLLLPSNVSVLWTMMPCWLRGHRLERQNITANEVTLHKYKHWEKKKKVTFLSNLSTLFRWWSTLRSTAFSASTHRLCIHKTTNHQFPANVESQSSGFLYCIIFEDTIQIWFFPPTSSRVLSLASAVNWGESSPPSQSKSENRVRLAAAPKLGFWMGCAQAAEQLQSLCPPCTHGTACIPAPSPPKTFPKQPPAHPCSSQCPLDAASDFNRSSLTAGVEDFTASLSIFCIVCCVWCKEDSGSSKTGKHLHWSVFPRTLRRQRRILYFHTLFLPGLWNTRHC